MNRGKFVITLTADFFDAEGNPRFRDVGLSEIAKYPHLTHQFMGRHQSVIGPDQIGGANGVIVMTPSVKAETVSQAGDLLAIGRFGVGYDAVDIEACTNADVLVFITAGAVDHSVAEATVGWMIALGHKVRAKDLLVRFGRWDERTQFMGTELRDRTLGIIGLGGIARSLLRLLKPFGLKRTLVFDPYITAEQIAAAGAHLANLDTVMRESDFVSLHCPLNDETRGLISDRELGLMKPTAFLINTARGGIVDEAALFDVLKCGRIGGAAIDCFADEPLAGPHPFGSLDNVLLAPHAIAWTHELFRDIGRSAFRGMIDLSLGRVPAGTINPVVLARPGFKAKWDRLRADEATATRGT